MRRFHTTVRRFHNYSAHGEPTFTQISHSAQVEPTFTQVSYYSAHGCRTFAQVSHYSAHVGQPLTQVSHFSAHGWQNYRHSNRVCEAFKPSPLLGFI